jgi:predicted polyphosphate/ATP-dependent NAD kinase
VPVSTSDVTVGLIANPAAGHDLRRLVSGASLSTNHEKVNLVRRLLAGLGACGVDRLLVMPDASGLALGIERAAEHHRVDRDGVWPAVDFVEIEVRQTIDDTRAAVAAMLATGVRAIVVLGGDGTARAVASMLDDTPVLALTTGTNNAFGVGIEATVAGLATGLVATGRCRVADGCRRAKQLEVRVGDRLDHALVDVAVVAASGVGARAVWHPAELRELVVTIAEPGAIGLSAIAAAVAPCRRDEPSGRHLVLGPGGDDVLVPIAPGLVRPVGVRETRCLTPGTAFQLASTTGVLALDGEREIVLDGDAPVLTLTGEGPVVVDVPKVLQLAAVAGWLNLPDPT